MGVNVLRLLDCIAKYSKGACLSNVDLPHRQTSNAKQEVVKMSIHNSSFINLSVQTSNVKQAYCTVSEYKHTSVQAEGLFAEKFIEHCQDTFVPIYRRVSEQYWNNSIYGNVRRPYYMCNHDVGLAEYYVPTVLNGDGFVQKHRIVVSVLPELDMNIYESEVGKLTKPLSTPMGIIDSTTIFVVAPKVTRQHAFKVWKEKFKAMLKIKRVAGCFAIPIIHPDPEIAFKKLLSHLTNFWNKRIKAFLDKLKIQAWQYDYNFKNIVSLLPKVIENYSNQIVYCLRSMIAHFAYFEDCLKGAFKRLGELSMLKMRIFDTARRLAETVSLLDVRERLKITERFEECLAVTCVVKDYG
jgi:hypothetical protein